MLPNQNGNDFKVKVVGSGDGKTFDELLYAMSDVLLDTIAKASQAHESQVCETIGSGKPSVKSGEDK